MKKILFSLIALFMMVIGVKAEVVPTFSSLAEGDYYLYNVEYKGFLVGANDWGTRASVSREKGLKIAVTKMGDTYKLGAMSPDNADGVWVDGSRAGNDQFTFAAGTNGTYTIGCTKFPNTFLTWTGDENNTRLNFTPDSLYSTWGLVSQADYDQYLLDLEAEKKAQDAENEKYGIFTGRIVNPEINGSTGWTCLKPGGGNGPLLNNVKFEYWNASASQGAFNYYQKIANLPEGKYVLGAEMYNSSNNIAGAVPNGNAGLYISNGETKVFVGVTEDGETLKPYKTDEILVYEGDEITIGVMNVGVMSARWFVADNFTLTRTGDLPQTTKVYATVTNQNGISKELGQQEITVSVNGENATVTLPAAELLGYAMESQSVDVNIDADGNISMVEGQTLAFTQGSTPITVTVTGVEGTYVDGKINVTVTATGSNGQSVTVAYSTINPNLAVYLLGDEETEYLLNSHSTVTIDQTISGIKVSGLDNMMEEVSYAIYGTDKETLAEGVLSVNTIGYAEFAPVSLYEGNQYNVVISTPSMIIFDQNVIGAAEAPVHEIAATIIAGEDEIALNTHSAVSAEMIKSIEVTFDGFAPQQAGYSLNTLVEVSDSLGSTWEIDETLAQGALSLNGKGYAEFEEAITLAQGVKYALIVNADNESATFEINGAYYEEKAIEVSLIAADSLQTEYLLNSHSIVTIEQPVSAIKVAGLDQVMSEISYAIYGMDKNTLAEGLLSVNTIGYAEFAPVSFYEGNQYKVVLTADSTVIYEQTVIGAAEAPVHEIAATIIAGEDEIALNTHSAVSAEMIKSIEVTFDGFAPQQAGYSLNTLVEVSDSLGSTWEIDETLAQGALSLNGKGYAEFEEAITLAQGVKYALIVNADNESATFEINGAYVEEKAIEVSLIAADSLQTEYLLNSHSTVTVDQPVSAIKVAGLDQVMSEISYAIYGMDKNTLAEGLLSVNTIGYAEFAPVSFYEGNQYKVVLTADSTVIYEQTVIGAAEPLAHEIAATIIAGEDEIALNTHSAVSAEMIKSIEVTFDGFAPQQAGYSLNTLVEVSDSLGTTWEIDETLAQGVLSLNGKGYAEFEEAITLAQGVKYALIVNADNESATFEINGAYVEEIAIIPALILGEEETTLNNHSAVSVDQAEAIKVTFENGAAVKLAMYEICEAIEEDSTLTYGDEIAMGELSINAFGYAQFEDAIKFEQGKRYFVRVMAWDSESMVDENYNVKDPIATCECLINGAYVEPVEIAVSLIADEETEYALNGHSIVTIDQPVSAIKVAGLDQVMSGVSYAIYGMDKNTLAEGLLSVNTIGYAEFAPVTFYEGNQYTIVIAADSTVIFEQTVIGAAEPLAHEIAATIIAGEDEIALNTHSAVSAEMIKAIEVTFDGFAPQQAGYSINTLVEVSDSLGTTWEIDETLAQGALSLNGKGYAELDEAITLAQGVKYALIVIADGESATFEINGTYEESKVITESRSWDFTDGEAVEAGNDFWGAVDSKGRTTLQVGLENDLLPMSSFEGIYFTVAKGAVYGITGNYCLQSGSMTVRIPNCGEGDEISIEFAGAGSEAVVTSDNIVEERVSTTATKAGTTQKVTVASDGDVVLRMTCSKGFRLYNIAVTPAAITGINNATTAVETVFAKTMVNGKLVIVKNGVKYNAAGVQVK